DGVAFCWSLAVYDDGSGPALYVGGFFTTAGGVPANRIARWDGQNWSAVGVGMTSGPGGQVRALAAYDDGTGTALYAAGSFLEADGAVVNRIAKWDGTQWLPLGDGSGLNTHAWDLEVFDDGSGPSLYVAGEFATAGGVTVNHIARWDGTSWSDVAGGTNDDVRALHVFDDGDGPVLYAAGDFTTAGGVPVQRVATWDGASWADPGVGRNHTVTTMTVHDDGGGEALYLAGAFPAAGPGFLVDGAIKWDGENWYPLGASFNNAIRDL